MNHDIVVNNMRDIVLDLSQPCVYCLILGASGR